MDKRWALLVVVSTGLLLITLDNSILYTALPTLVTELGASNSQGLWIINAYPMVMAGLLLGSGTLGDRIGHRTMFLIGLVLFGIASLVAAFSPTPEILIGARAFLAVGAAAMMPATLALIRVTFTDDRERNLAIAIWGSISVIGAALGPIVGGILLEFFWWGSVFLINVPVVILAVSAIIIIDPPNSRNTERQWDLMSSLQIMIGLIAAVFAIKELSSGNANWSTVAISVAIAVIGFTLFARRQMQLRDPLLDFAIFRNPAFSAGVVAAALATFTVAGLQLASTQRFQLLMDYSPLQSGLLVAAVALGALPTALLCGAFLHRIGLLVTISGGMAVSVVGVIVVMEVMAMPIGWTIAGFLITGAGLGCVMGVASSSILGNAPVSRAGMAASVEEVSYEFGSLIAVALLGSLLTFGYTRAIDLPADAPPAAAESLTDALMVAGDQPETIAAAHMAFDSGYNLVIMVLIAIVGMGTVLTGWMLRRYGPGSQSYVYASK